MPFSRRRGGSQLMMRWGATIEELLVKFGYDIVFMLEDDAEETTILNSGTAGSALNGTLHNDPDRIEGPLGGGYDFDAANHGISVPDGAAKDAIEASANISFSIFWMPRGAGASNSGHIYGYGNADHRLFFNSSMAPRARVSRGTTIADTTASTTLTVDVPQWLHQVYTGNVSRLFRDAGALQELAYSGQTAGVGTQNSSANALYFGNRLSLTLAVNAEIYCIAYGKVALTEQQLGMLGYFSGL